jgi:hypothetical protein
MNSAKSDTFSWSVETNKWISAQTTDAILGQADFLPLRGPTPDFWPETTRK